jgi:ribokinase
MKTLVYGSLNIDLVFSVDHVVIPGETISSASFTRSAGGKGANQAAALAKAGMKVYMAGKAGADGEFILDLLRSYGVNTDHVVRSERATGQAMIQVDRNGQNSIVLYAGCNAEITKEEIAATLADFGSGDTLVLQNEIAHTGFIIEQAKKRGLRICLNPSPYNEKIENLPLDLADMFFVNEIEGAALAGLSPQTAPAEILDGLVKRFPNAELILTAGKDGAYYGQGAKRAKGDIVDLPVVDTTGAGDTFSGYFFSARSRGMELAESLHIACKAASIAVSRKGAMESVPFAKEVF